MTIGIDASRLLLKNRTGIEEYSYQIIKAFSKELENEKVVLYFRPAAFEGALDDLEKNNDLEQKVKEILKEHLDFELPQKWQVKIIHFSYFWTQIGLALEMLIYPIDALFVPAHTVPWIHPKKTVVVVHGLEYEHCPQSYSFFSKIFHRFFVKRSCCWASEVVAISEKTKDDLLKMYKCDKNKLKVVYNGANMEDEKKSDTEKKDTTKKLPGKFLFFLSRLEERKNLLGVIECFDILQKKYGYQGKLVLGGRPGVGYEKAKKLIKKKKLENEILEFGFVSEVEKWEMMKKAETFLFPSLCEGFGLPILEAQLVGTPVITSNLSPMSEVAGNKQILVDPGNYQKMAEKVDRILKDKKFQAEIVKKGKENVKRFSWERTAKEIVEMMLV